MKELMTRYLERLSELYPTIAKASTEIINLQAILNLPKGTEHFLTDIHGEYEAFSHVLKNGSGSVRRKIEDVFGNTMSSREKQFIIRERRWNGSKNQKKAWRSGIRSLCIA